MLLMAGALLAAVGAAAPAAPSRRPQAAALRNCSAVPTAEAPRFAFSADDAKLQWQADKTQCLSTATPHGVNTTGINLRDCASSIDWARVAERSRKLFEEPVRESYSRTLSRHHCALCRFTPCI